MVMHLAAESHVALERSFKPSGRHTNIVGTFVLL
ncbi:hypothetical protein, partial [Candidatus Pseudothioglobus singularis]